MPPLDLWIRDAGFKTLCRIKKNCRIDNLFDWELAGELVLEPPIPMDVCTKKWDFTNAHVVHLAEGKEWKGGSHKLLKQGIICFPDGSMNERGWRQKHRE